jgi:GNAT superfamily N-acetyltransferase
MKVSLFDRSFARDAFCCGVEPLDVYLKKHLTQDLKRNAAACFVLHHEGSREILGYYTLSAFVLELDRLPEALQKRLPRYPEVPATLLGRLALDRSIQGTGQGELLLLDALKRAWRNREVVGSWAVVVDASNESAARFYRYFAFQDEGMPADRLFLPMTVIAKLF